MYFDTFITQTDEIDVTQRQFITRLWLLFTSQNIWPISPRNLLPVLPTELSKLPMWLTDLSHSRYNIVSRMFLFEIWINQNEWYWGSLTKSGHHSMQWIWGFWHLFWTKWTSFKTRSKHSWQRQGKYIWSALE